MAPEIRAVRDRLVVDLDGVVNRRQNRVGGEFENAAVVLVDAEFIGSGEHAVAFNAGDDFLAERYVGCDDPGAAVRGPADDSFHAVRTGIHFRDNVLLAFDFLDFQNIGEDSAVEEFAGDFDAVALGRLHGDETFEGLGIDVEARDEFANPVV